MPDRIAENCDYCPTESGRPEDACNRLIVNGLCKLWEYKEFSNGESRYYRKYYTPPKTSPLNPSEHKQVTVVLPDEQYL